MSRKLDLLLVHPPSRLEVYQGLGRELAAVENPVWAGLFASAARSQGLSARILDAEALELSPAEVAARVQDEDALLVAVVAFGHQPSASTQTMTAAGRTVQAIKETSPDQKVLLVGGHVAALPERTLREEAADYVAAGEGFETIIDLARALRAHPPDLAKVRGLWFRDQDGSSRRGPPAALLRDLDERAPDGAWDLLPMERYRAHNWQCLGGRDRSPYAAIYTSLGCPYHCSFCCIQAPFKEGERASGRSASIHSYRLWRPETVLGWIDHLHERYGVRNFKIADEMFVLNRRHVLAICDGLIERRRDLQLWAYTRVDTIDDELIDRLAAAGFRWLAVGIEAGSARVLDDVDKGFGKRDVRLVLGRIRAAGIHVIANYIFGLPEDDFDSMNATLDLALELRTEFANFYSAMAYPGSPLYERALAAGVPLPERWTGYSQHSRDCLPLPTRHVTAREVLAFRDQAFHRYYTDPRYLDLMAETFGTRAAEEIRRMTSLRLERDLLEGRTIASESLFPSETLALAERGMSIAEKRP